MNLKTFQQSELKRFDEERKRTGGYYKYWIVRLLNSTIEKAYALGKEESLAEIEKEACKGFPRDATYEKLGFSVTDNKRVGDFMNGWHFAKKLLFEHINLLKNK